MLGCYFNIEGCSNIMLPCYWHHISDLNVTYYVALNAQLEETLCYCVTVGAKIVLTQR